MKYSLATIALLGLALSNSLVSGREGGFRLSQTTSKSLAGISSGLFLQDDADTASPVEDDSTDAPVVTDDSTVVADDSTVVADDSTVVADDSTVVAPASTSDAVVPAPSDDSTTSSDDSTTSTDDISPVVVSFQDLDFDATDLNLEVANFTTVATQINNGLPVEFKSDDWIANIQAIIIGGADPTSLILD
jgi:hypothetical protein